MNDICAEFDLVNLEDGVDGDGDLDDGLGAVEGRWCDQPVVRRLNHQLATPNLGKHHHTYYEYVCLKTWVPTNKP